jgi:hypothetical protein
MWTIYRVRDSVGRYYLVKGPGYPIAPFTSGIRGRVVCTVDDEPRARHLMDELNRRKMLAKWRRAQRAALRVVFSR